MLVEVKEMVFELVPGKLIIFWFSFKKLLKNIDVPSSFPLLRLSSRRFGKYHD